MAEEKPTIVVISPQAKAYTLKMSDPEMEKFWEWYKTEIKGKRE